MKQNYVCGASRCQVNLDKLIRTIDDGKQLIALCPNDEVIWTVHRHRGEPYEIETHPSQLGKEPITCEICEKTQEFQTSNENKTVLYTLCERDKKLHLELCQHHLNRLILLDLTPKDYFILRKKHGIFHEIHDDFYDEEGRALQPVEL